MAFSNRSPRTTLAGQSALESSLSIHRQLKLARTASPLEQIVAQMNVSDIIAKKRDGQQLTTAEIEWFITSYTSGAVPDYQMSALSMAICINGMQPTEIHALTLAMLESGITLRWPQAGRPLVDKHSTGGIGDKVSLVLAPLLACCGLRVPMISGRGLGVTGGTLDKLESIQGFRTDLTLSELQNITEQVGCVITGTTEDLSLIHISEPTRPY